jgi:hypothetical protein
VGNWDEGVLWELAKCGLENVGELQNCRDAWAVARDGRLESLHVPYIVYGGAHPDGGYGRPALSVRRPWLTSVDRRGQQMQADVDQEPPGPRRR